MRLIIGLVATFISQFVLSDPQIDTVCESKRLNILKEDCLALVDFYHSFSVVDYDVDGTWGSYDVSTWDGVKIEQGRVTSIMLPGVYRNVFLKGFFENSFSNLSELEYLDLRYTHYTGPLPDFWGKLGNLETLRLTARKSDVINTFPESVKNLNKLKILDLGNLKIRSYFPDIWGKFPSLRELRLHSNLFYGEVGPSIVDLKKLSRLALDRNPFLWGEFPFEILNNDSVQHISIDNSGFWGEIPEFVLNGKPVSDARTHIFIGTNHFINSPANTGRTQTQESYYDLHDTRQTLSEGQEGYLINIDIQLAENGSAALAPKIAGERGRIFIVPDPGYKANKVKGCAGELVNSVFFIDDNQDSCVAEISFSQCIGVECVVDLGATNNVSNVSIESPSSRLPLSGVAQLRGWINAPDWENKFSLYGYYGVSSTFSISLDGGERQYYKHMDSRSDVRGAMGEKWEIGKPYLGWSVPVYSGNLNNGLHTLDVFNAIGLHVASRTFRVFNPETNGSVQYIHNVERTIRIEDFPVHGHTSELAFNTAEQKFSVTNQFDADGNSLRSEEWHSITGEQRYSSSSRRKKSSLAGERRVANIENPSGDSILSGVQSLRGWFVGDGEYDSELDRYIDYGWKSIAIDLADSDQVRTLSFHERRDVNESFGINGNYGWTILWYSGLLKNGWHTIDLGAYDYSNIDVRYVIQEIDFLSFTPVDENGEQFYVRSYDRDILVEDFPYQGSDVTLRFDPAGQNFVIVDQVIH